MNNPYIVVVDGQGGQLGREISDRILTSFPDANLLVLGTNSAATSNMLKGKAKRGATGENPILVACRKADLIVGPIGIILADAMLGEITPAIATAISGSDAHKILIPISRCGVKIAGSEDLSLKDLLEDTIQKISVWMSEQSK